MLGGVWRCGCFDVTSTEGIEYHFSLSRTSHHERLFLAPNCDTWFHAKIFYKQLFSHSFMHSHSPYIEGGLLFVDGSSTTLQKFLCENWSPSGLWVLSRVKKLWSFHWHHQNGHDSTIFEWRCPLVGEGQQNCAAKGGAAIDGAIQLSRALVAKNLFTFLISTFLFKEFKSERTCSESSRAFSSTWNRTITNSNLWVRFKSIKLYFYCSCCF